MREAIAAVKWVARGVLVVAMLGAGWMSYKFFTEPGYLADLAMRSSGRMVDLRDPDPETRAVGRSVVTSRLPQTSTAPARGGTSRPVGGRGADGSGQPRTGSTSSAETYAPRTTATGGLRTVEREKEAPPPGYAPPVAQRKVLRVGE